MGGGGCYSRYSVCLSPCELCPEAPLWNIQTCVGWRAHKITLARGGGWGRWSNGFGQSQGGVGGWLGGGKGGVTVRINLMWHHLLVTSTAPHPHWHRNFWKAAQMHHQAYCRRIMPSPPLQRDPPFSLAPPPPLAQAAYGSVLAFPMNCIVPPPPPPRDPHLTIFAFCLPPRAGCVRQCVAISFELHCSLESTQRDEATAGTYRRVQGERNH